MKKNIHIILVGILLIIISGCAKIDYLTYKQNPVIKGNTSIVLLGIKGHRTVNYIQFMSYRMIPALNYRGLAITNDIIALKVPTPLEDFDFGVFTTGQAGYVTYGNMHSSYGYIPVKAKSIDINKQGVYFYGILDTDKETIEQKINQDFLDLAKQKYKDLLKDLEPINF